MLQDCQICDWSVLDIAAIVTIIPVSIRSITLEMTWESDGSLLSTDKPMDPEAEQCFQAETHRRDIVLTGCAVFLPQ